MSCNMEMGEVRDGPREEKKEENKEKEYWITQPAHSAKLEVDSANRIGNLHFLLK